jgi:ATP-dependent exoDNAse (exonuclease V) beta subunit
VTSADDEARSRIREELDTTLVVVAGAGTGKTTELVRRIVNLVRTGTARLRDIAAITFTEAAAAELRERIRQELGTASDDTPGEQLIRSATEELDDAVISTLHAFAQRILLEHCAAAGLPADFEVLDDTADAVDFEVRWARFADGLLSDADAEPALVKGFACGLRHTDLRAVARVLHDNWDRLEECVDYDDEGLVAVGTQSPEVDAAPVEVQLDRALSLVSCCTNEDDNLLAHLRLVMADARAQLGAADGDEQAVLRLLASLPSMRCVLGRQDNWGDRIDEVREACATAEEARGEILTSVRRAVLLDLLPRLIDFVLQAAKERHREGRLTFHDLLVHARRLLRSGGEPVEALRRRYRWIFIDEFQDTDPIQVELATRLVSEVDGEGELRTARPGSLFAVGDPKQSIYRFRRADIELFEQVSAEVGECVVLQTNFRSVPGILELVNAVFGELFGSLAVPGQAQHHALHGNRFALPSVMPEEPDILERPAWKTAPTAAPHEADEPVQLAFDQLRPSDQLRQSDQLRPSDELQSEDGSPHPENNPVGESHERADEIPEGTTPSRARAPVVVLGEGLEGSIPDVRREAARDAARCIHRMVEDRWPVADTTDGRLRATRFRDVAVLMPARTSLPSLEEAFEDAGVPYRLEGASMLWGTEDVRDVLAVLRAADDPADGLSVLAALRSPGLGCGDDDLVSWQRAGGRWDPRAHTPPELGDHPVALAMAVLESLHRERWWLEPSAVVVRAIEDLRSFELAFAYRRPRDHWHRLRWLCDQARLFDETEGGTLRAFLAWAQQQAQSDGGARGVGPPDPDDDAVRVMTVHGAKGLEFPVVLLAGLERQEPDRHHPQPVLWTENGSLEARAGRFFRTDGYEEASIRDQELNNFERQRLLYVGMTRARDHLVLCLHHRAHNGTEDSSLASRLFELCEARPDLWRRLPPDTCSSQPVGTTRAGGARSANPDKNDEANLDKYDEANPDDNGTEWKAFYERWAAERAALLGALRRRPVTTATALAEAAAPRGPASGPAPNVPGRPEAGAPQRQSAEVSLQIGRAVHDVLAAVDLTSGRDLSGRPIDELSRARALAHGVGKHVGSVTSMASAALASAVVRRAASKRHWRELYVGIPIETRTDPVPSSEPRLLEGFVDLVFEDDDGLVVVDYKTDRIAGPDTVNATATYYRPQIAAYAAALERSCGQHVSRCVLLLLGDDRLTQYVLEGKELAAARAEALGLAMALTG